MLESFTQIKKVAIFGSVRKQGFTKALRELYSVLTAKSVEIFLDTEVSSFVLSEKLTDISDFKKLQTQEYSSLDLALSLGGDGTFLRTAYKLGEAGIPILGINLGNLGFLVDVPGDEISAAINEIFSCGFTIEERSVLSLKRSDNEHKSVALNEIAVLKQDSSSMIRVHTIINGEYLCTYRADGLLISTPTGSTAYALSVGASIMMPENKSFMLSPVAPHSLNLRPVIIPDHWKIELEVESRTNHFLVSLDGRSSLCTNSVRLSIEKAPYSVKVAKRLNHTYFNTLREKLMWGADARLR
jgi:NAD+ kinase